MSATRNAATMKPLTHAMVIHGYLEGIFSTVRAAGAAIGARRRL